MSLNKHVRSDLAATEFDDHGVVSARDRLPRLPITYRGWRHIDGSPEWGRAAEQLDDFSNGHAEEAAPIMGVRQHPSCEAHAHYGWDYYGSVPAKARKSDLKPDVARRIKAARSIVYASSDACAKALKVHVNTWRNYEKGERYPDPWILVQFCDITGFTTDFVYRGRFRGIEQDVQLRLAAEYPALVDEAPDVGRHATATVPV